MRRRAFGVGLSLVILGVWAPRVGAASAPARPLMFSATGSGTVASVDYTRADGTRARLPKATLPWKISFEAGDGTYTVSVTNTAKTGTVSCSIDSAARPVTTTSATTATCTVRRFGKSETYDLSPKPGSSNASSSSSTDPLTVSSTLFPKLTAPGGDLFTRLNVSGELVSWLANPTTVSVFLPPDSGRTIPAPDGARFRDTAVVGNAVFAVDTLGRLLRAELDRGGFQPVANIADASALYATNREVWVRVRTNGKSTMHRFDGITGKPIGQLPGIHSLLAASPERIATIADGPDAQSLLLVVFNAATMKQLSSDKFTQVIHSGAWASRDVLLLALPDAVAALDYATKQITNMKDVASHDIIGEPASGTLMALSNGHLGYWLPIARKVVDIGIAPTGAAGLRDGVFWAWDKTGLVRIDLVRLADALAKRGHR